MHLRLLASVCLVSAAACAPGDAPRPNFVLILADDLGFADLGIYGSRRNRTPHLDRMAREGLRFVDFHSNGPMCTPTRAALLTGRYPQRFGANFESALSGIEDYGTGLPQEARTIAELLGEAGYATGMFGKWHLGYQPPFLPGDQGFGEFRGLASGDGDHHSHIDRSGRKDWWRDSEIAMEEGYSVDLITKHSVDFIERHRGEPFFLYVAHLAIHFPWQGPRDPPYRVEGGNYHDLSKLGQLTSKDVSAQVSQMVEAVDASVGAILKALREQELERSTLVFFTSDNGGYRTYQGGYHNISENGRLRGQKTDLYEGGHRVPAIARWPERVGPGISPELAATFDLVPTFLELAGIARDATAFDGQSLAPVLFHGAGLPPRTLFWRMRGHRAVRQGRWKLVSHPGAAPELYDLAEDLGESNDLSGAREDVVQAMAEALGKWEAALERELPQELPANQAKSAPVTMRR